MSFFEDFNRTFSPRTGGILLPCPDSAPYHHLLTRSHVTGPWLFHQIQYVPMLKLPRLNCRSFEIMTYFDIQENYGPSFPKLILLQTAAISFLGHRTPSPCFQSNWASWPLKKRFVSKATGRRVGRFFFFAKVTEQESVRLKKSLKIICYSYIVHRNNISYALYVIIWSTTSINWNISLYEIVVVDRYLHYIVAKRTAQFCIACESHA